MYQILVRRMGFAPEDAYLYVFWYWSVFCRYGVTTDMYLIPKRADLKIKAHIVKELQRYELLCIGT